MNRYLINFNRLIHDIIDYDLRTSKRLKFIFLLLKWIRNLYQEFVLLNNELDIIVKLKGSAIAIEKYLNDTVGTGITITTHEISFEDAFIAANSDVDFGLLIGNQGDGDDFGVFISGSDYEEPVSYSVNVPSSFTTEQIERIKAICARYQVPSADFHVSQ